MYEKKGALEKFIHLAHDVSLSYYKTKNYAKAIHYVKEEIRVGRHIFDSITYKKRLYNLARFYYSNQQFEESIIAHKKIIDSFTIDPITYKSYCQIGRSYNKTHDYFQSVNYYEKGLSRPELLSKSSTYGHYVNYAYVLESINSKKSLAKGLAILKKAEKLAIKLNKNQISLRNAFASYYKNELVFNYKKANSYYKKNLKKALLEKDTISLIKTYSNLGEVLNIAKNDSAEYYIKKGLVLSNKKKELRARLYFNLAEFYSNKARHKDAIKTTHKALIAALPVNISSTPNHVLSIHKALTSNNKGLIWHILTEKSRYYLDNFNATNDSLQAFLALKNIEIADQLLNSIRLESFEKASKLIWQDYASTTYLLAVKACYLLNKEDQAFYFIEKNKALLLLENISENQIKKQEHFPDSITKKQKFHLENITAIENKLNLSRTNKDSLSTAYFDAKIAYKKFMESLEKNYPKYYNYKTPASIINLKDFQNQLDPNTLIVEYILDDTDGYIIAINKHQKQLYKLNDLADLQLATKQYLNNISKPFVLKKEAIQTDSLSSHLRDLLMPYLKKTEFKNKPNLVIVPDYTLQNLPFETLKNPEGSYIISDYLVSYAYSMSFLLNNAAIKRNPKQSFIGFAPETFTYNNLGALKNSTAEITLASSLFKGKTFINNLATKEAFLSTIKDHQIIHLSTHANANDSNSPWIAFKSKKLYLNEIHMTKNQAELVILSACKTSLGDIKKGEGVFSLARGFFYSGANSVVSSLWNVNDKSTQEVISSFYTYLEKGQNKSAALRLAKLDYLKNNSHSEISPYYWSSLILIGDRSTIDTPTNYLLYFIVFIILLIAFFLRKTNVLGNLLNTKRTL